MKLGIMQPYFFPYLGYFQLLNLVDSFVIYDNIQFTKKGWIHRNRILVNGKETLFTINLNKDSDYLDIVNRVISPAYTKEREKLIRQIKNGYQKSPNFNNVFPLIKSIIEYDSENLFEYILNSIKKINEYLNINTKMIISSSLNVPYNLKGQDRVLDTCLQCGCNEYVNPIGGEGLYSKEFFKENGIDLSFIEMDSIIYSQGKSNFISHLSIIDVLMWNSKETVIEYLSKYQIK